MTGRTLSHYQILGRIGEGGMGVVYRARDTRLERVVALKLLRPGKGGDPDRKRRFGQEARAASALNHPNIATIYDIGCEDGTDFIAMEYVDGEALDRTLACGALSVRDALRYGWQTADALAKAHAAGIIHRDLKPANILVNREGAVKLVDFGLAKLTLPPEGEADAETCTYHPARPVVTEEGVIAGTAAYMSPEQAEGRTLDPRTDIFSLGAVLYEMFSGRRAFQGQSHISTITAVLRDEPPALSQVDPRIPREVERLVMRCLRKEADRRFQHMGDVALGLQELKEESDSGQLQAFGQPVRPKRSGAALWMAALLAVLMAAVAGMALFRERKPEAVPHVRFSRLTDEPGEEDGPSLSPDGKSLVYFAHTAAGSDIYLRRVGGRNSINLTAGSGAQNTWPKYSPDGDSIAFASTRDGGGVFVMGATGESVRRVVDFGTAPAWSPDGSQIAFTTVDLLNPNYRLNMGELWVADVASGARRLIPATDAVQASWSPHGRRIAFWGYNAQRWRHVWTVAADAQTGGAQPVLDEPFADWAPVWSPDGQFLYFSSNRGGVVNLWRVPIDEETGRALGSPQPVTTPSPHSAFPSFSRDGKLMVYMQAVYSENLTALPFDPAAERIGAPHLITSGGRTFRSPAVSPDGKRLAFSSSGGNNDIYVSNADGSDMRQLTDDRPIDRCPQWMPDGQRIVFYSARSGASEVWSIGADGSGLRQITNSTKSSVWFPAVSGDGGTLSYYEAGVGSFLLDLRTPNAAPHAIPNVPDRENAFMAWNWSPDGRQISMSGQRGQRICCGVAVYTPATNVVVRLTDTGWNPVWLRDSRRLLFEDEGHLRIVDSATRRVKDLGAVRTVGSERMSLSPDGRTLYLTTGGRESDLWLAVFE